MLKLEEKRKELAHNSQNFNVKIDSFDWLGIGFRGKRAKVAALAERNQIRRIEYEKQIRTLLLDHL